MVLCAAVRGKTMNTFRQTAVGVFVLLGLICVGYLTIKLGKMEVVTDKGFELSATFNSDRLPPGMMPALANSTSTRPNRSLARETSASMSSRRVTSEAR